MSSSQEMKAIMNSHPMEMKKEQLYTVQALLKLLMLKMRITTGLK